MKSRFAIAGVPGLLFAGAAVAAGWNFETPVDVTPAHGERVFHHLESAARKNIAASADTLAVAWEDNRDGTPRCYVSRKKMQDAGFSHESTLSDKGPCYEPALVATGNGRFVAAYEEDGRIRARVVTLEKAGASIALTQGESTQVTLGADGDILYAAWSEKEGAYARIRVAKLEIEKDQLRIAHSAAAESAPIKDDQLYPAIAPAANGEVVVAWEDRRHGHTSIVFAFSADGKTFTAPRDVNEAFRGGPRNLGRGSGAMRVSLARQDAKRVIAVWLDKRDFLSGYDVYAAHGSDGGRSFGKNQKVQDSFGDATPQWHPAVTARGEQIVVAWDDDRDGTGDVWMAWPETDGWSGDSKAAGGAGSQSGPSLTLDDAGNLHLIWLERAEVSGATRLRYALGRVR